MQGITKIPVMQHRTKTKSTAGRVDGLRHMVNQMECVPVTTYSSIFLNLELCAEQYY